MILHMVMLLNQTLALHPLLIQEIMLIMKEEATCSQGTKELVTTTTLWNRYYAYGIPSKRYLIEFF